MTRSDQTQYGGVLIASAPDEDYEFGRAVETIDASKIPDNCVIIPMELIEPEPIRKPADSAQ